MNKLPPDLQMFGAYLDAQPQPVREAFQYCLCLIMLETGGMKLVKKIPGDDGMLCFFETTAGDAFAISRPPIKAEEEAGIVEVLRDIMRDQGIL